MVHTRGGLFGLVHERYRGGPEGSASLPYFPCGYLMVFVHSAYTFLSCVRSVVYNRGPCSRSLIEVCQRCLPYANSIQFRLAKLHTRRPRQVPLARTRRPPGPFIGRGERGRAQRLVYCMDMVFITHHSKIWRHLPSLSDCLDCSQQHSSHLALFCLVEHTSSPRTRRRHSLVHSRAAKSQP